MAPQLYNPLPYELINFPCFRAIPVGAEDIFILIGVLRVVSFLKNHFRAQFRIGLGCAMEVGSIVIK